MSQPAEFSDNRHQIYVELSRPYGTIARRLPLQDLPTRTPGCGTWSLACTLAEDRHPGGRPAASPPPRPWRAPPSTPRRTPRSPRCLQREPFNSTPMAVNSISSGSPRVRPIGRACGELDEIKKNTHPKKFTALIRERTPAGRTGLEARGQAWRGVPIQHTVAAVVCRHSFASARRLAT